MRKIFPPFARFRHFPVWTQATITLGSAAILVAVWSACGGVGPPRPPALSTPRTELRGRFGAVHALAFSPSGEWLAAGTADKEARLWDVAKGNVIRTMKGHRDAVTSVAVTADGKMLATGSADKTVKLWDTSTGNEIRTLVAHAGAITSVAFSPEGRWLASASLDKSVILWEVSSGNQFQKLTGHTERVNAVAFSPDGRLLASVSDDKTALLWDPQNGNLVRTLSGSVSRIAALAFSPDGTVLATGSLLRLGFHVNRQGEIRLWKVESGALDGSFERIFGNVRGLAFSPDGRTLASAEDFAQASSNSVITFWDVRKQTVLSQYDAERRGQLYAIAYSPDGRWLATGGHSGRIRFWQ